MTKEKNDTKCDDLIDALLEKHGISPEAVLGENGLIAQLKKRVVERALAGELTHHLGYAKGEAPEEVDNHRNGYSKKTVVGESGAMEIEIPRDRSGSFDPLLIAKGQKRFEGFDEKIIAMYARGMTVREIGRQRRNRERAGVTRKDSLCAQFAARKGVDSGGDSGIRHERRAVVPFAWLSAASRGTWLVRNGLREVAYADHRH